MFANFIVMCANIFMDILVRKLYISVSETFSDSAPLEQLADYQMPIQQKSKTEFIIHSRNVNKAPERL